MTVQGSPTVGPGQAAFSNAFTLNGSSTYLTNLHTSDDTDTGLPIYGAGSYTVAVWVKGPGQTNRYIFSEGSVGHGVFVNAIRLVVNLVAIGITKATVVGGNLRLTAETEYPGMTSNLEQSNSVTGPWVPATGGTIISSVGPAVVIEYPIDPTINLFYRGKRKP